VSKVRLRHSDVLDACTHFQGAMSDAGIEDFYDPDCTHVEEDIDKVVVALLRAGWTCPVVTLTPPSVSVRTGEQDDHTDNKEK